MTDLHRHHGDHVTSVHTVRAGWDRLDAEWADAAAGRHDRHHERTVLDEAARFGRALEAVARTIQSIERDLL